MAPRRRELSTDEDPWRVSAFISALLELLLSLLLLLGAAIAFITFQLVKCFGLDPPCTYIGCSHPLLPHTSSKWRRYSSRFRHRRAKGDHLSEPLFPDFRNTRRYRKLQPKHEEFFTIDDDTDESILSEKNDSDSRHSTAATSDLEFRQGNFDESCVRSYSNRNANRVRSARSWPIYKKPTTRKYVKSKASVFNHDGKQCAKEECIPLFPTRTASAHSNNLDVDEDSSPSSERPSFQKEKSQREILTGSDAPISRDNKHGYHQYTLLVDKEPSQRKCAKQNAAFLGRDGLQFAREELVPLYSPRSVSACGSISDVEDGCRMTSTSTDDLEKPSFQKEKVQRGTLRDVEALASMKSGHEYHYILLEDEECNQLKSVRADFVRNGMQSANQECVRILRRAFGSDSDAEEDDCEMSSTSTDGFKKPSLQKEMPEGVDINAPISSDIEHAHHYMLLEDEDEELCKAPFFDCKEGLARNIEDEHHDLLSDDGKDEEVVKAPFFSNLQKDGAQPLLECISDSRSESPENSTADLGNNIAKVVPGEWIKGSTATPFTSPCNLSSGLGEGQCMVPLFTVSATSESIVKEKRFVIQDKIQVNTDFSADEGNLDSIQGFENANPGNFDGIMVEDQVGEDGIPSGEVHKEPLEVLLNVQILEKEDIDVGEDASNPYIASDLQGLCEYVSLNRGIEDNCSTLDTCVQEIQGKSREETMLKASLEVSIQEKLDLCLISFDGCGSEGKCANSSDNIDVHVGQVEVAKGNILEALEKPCHYGDSHTHEPDSKFEQGELAWKDPCKGSQGNTAIDGSCAEEVEINQSLNIRKAKSRILKHEISSEQMILKSQVMKAEEIKEDTSINEDEEEGLDALKEALRIERITLAALETELENERNAAAIATNEAMAMISRLQEEKSAMQMEVKQLQRMSEEKADYDEQAMELLKEILLKREKEKHALEKEVELYRERLLAEKGDMLKKISIAKSNKYVSKPALTPMLLLTGIDEGHDSLSPEGKNDRLKTLPSLEAFYDAEITLSPHIASMGQSMACREELGSSSLPIELKDTELSRVNQVGTCFQEEGNPAEYFTNELHSIDQEPRGTSRSIFSTNDEETQFILERLWVLEEELRELRREDGLGASSEAPHGDEENRMKRKCDRSYANPGGASGCTNGVFGEQNEDDAAGMLLPIHDVYEVQPTPDHPGEGAQHGDTLEYSEKMLKDFEGFPRDNSHAYMAASGHEYSTHNISQARILLPSKEAQGGSALALNQDYLRANDTHEPWLEAAEGRLVATDNIQQLAMRLQVLETDRGLLINTLESSRQRDAELRLLQEIARHLRGLQMVGRSGLFLADEVSIEDVSQQDRDDKAGRATPAFGQSCASVLKKRRYCNGPGQAQTLLLQQRSI